MKKIIIMLVFIVNVLLFFQVIDVYKEQDYSDIHGFEYSQEDVFHRYLLIYDDEQEINDQAIFDMFQNITQSDSAMIIFTDHDFDKSEYRMYISTSTPVDKRLSLVTDKSLNFHEQDIYFYTNQHGVENGVNFFLLNDRIDVRFYPMAAMGGFRDGGYMFVSTSQEELDEMIDIFMAEYGSFVIDIVDMGREPLDADGEIRGFLTPIISVTMILIFLILLMYIHVHSKKIAIFKTMGMSSFDLFRQLFLPLIAGIIATVILTYSVLFLLVVGTFNVRTTPIIWTFIQSASYQFIGVAITMIIGNLLLILIPTYSLLKNSNMNRFLMGVNLIVKILLLVILLPQLSGRIEIIQENIGILNRANSYESNGLADYQFTIMFHRDYQNIQSNYFSLLDEIGWENRYDEEWLDKYELLYEYHEAYQILKDAGALLSQGSVFGWGEDLPSLIVNESYLDKHPIKGLDGEWINLDDGVEGDVVHLIPQMYIEKFDGDFFTSMIRGANDEFIEIANEQTVFDYSLAWNWSGVQDLPYIITIYRDSFFHLDASIFNNMFIHGDLNELLRDTIFYDRIIISTVGEELNRIKEYSFNGIMDNVIILLPTFALVSLIIIQYAYLYLKVFRKRIYAKKLMGQNPFHIISHLLIESSMAVIASIVIAWYLDLNFELIIVVIGIEVAVYLAAVVVSQWKHSLVADYDE